jgi:hypothetical protein
MVALEIYEDDLCDGCRLPSSVRNDPSNLFRLDHDVCPVCAQLAPAGRVQADEDRKAREALGENAPPKSPLPSDGRTTRMMRVSDQG